MSAWPSFHWDGSVTIAGHVIGRKYSNGLGGFRFVCTCGHIESRPMVRELRRAVAAHVETQGHLDRILGVTP